MGKQALIYVLGLSMLLGYKVLNLNSTSLTANDSFTRYYSQNLAHSIALAGANIGTHLCLSDTGYSTNLIAQQLSGGTFDVRFQKSGDTTRVISTSRVPQYSYNYRTAKWENEVRDTIEATLRRVRFCKYGYFTDSEGGAYWATGDSVFGPAHTNDQFGFSGRPYFDSKLTAARPAKYASGAMPTLLGGYEWGITVPRPATTLSDLANRAAASGAAINANGNDVKMVFINDGRVGIKIPASSGTMRNDTLPLSTVAPTGIIAVNGGDIRVQGTYKGAITISASKGSYSSKGNVYIESNNLIGATNPATNPASGDMLGIVAEKDIIVAKDLTRNSSTVVNIQATMYSQTGTFIPESYTTIPNSGKLNIYGGVIANWVGATAKYSGSTITNGFAMITRFDNRFTTKGPPLFPTSPKYELFSWWEN